MSKPVLSLSVNSNDMFALYYIAWFVACMGSYLSLVAITNKRAVSAPPTTSYAINIVKLDITLNTVLCNIKVSKVKLSNHRKLIILALLLASGDVEIYPGPITDPSMVHCANESVCHRGYCQLAVDWSLAVACHQCGNTRHGLHNHRNV